MNNAQTAHVVHHDVYTIVTNRIIAQLEEGTVPWRKSWSESGLPQNLISKRLYRGINLLLLASLGYSENFFLSYKQLKEVGGMVKEGEKAHIVVYWNWILEHMELGERPSDHSGSAKKIPFLRYYKVFNIAQCEGIPERLIPTVTREAYPIPACERIVEEMPKRPKVQHRDRSPYYNPLHDYVNMPKKESFESDEGYYATLFHELIHSTGHHSRLNRSTLIQMAEFGSEPYSHEELVAEIGACYLEFKTGIIDKEFEQSAAYINGWLAKLRNDRKFIVSASSHAQKAADFILNTTFEAHEEVEEKEAVNDTENEDVV